jgi:poly(hydroxyalkanoate) depolymerase family esterase
MPKPSRTAVAATALTVLAALTAITVLAAPARAATLSPVTGFGSNPGNLAMYAYRPDGQVASAPLVVALHGCTQTAADYFDNAGWRKYADLWGFVLVVPEQRTSNNANRCFNWFEPGDTARGSGEALSIRQMVGHAVTTYGLDPARVFVTGLSAGGAMTAVMLATYPDVFAGGAIMAGLPYRCATSVATAFTCMNPGVDRTPAQWGGLVRGAHAYTGTRPRVEIWHGTADTTVVPANATELRDQWTDALGVSQTPTSTRTLPGGTSVEVYGADAVLVYRIAGMPHATPVDPGAAADQCGTAGTYYRDTICAAYHTGRNWGLSGGAPPTSTPPASSPPPVCVRANNYEHVRQGRAYHRLGYTYAAGSGQAMGLYTLAISHGLRQTGPGHWVVADSEC